MTFRTVRSLGLVLSLSLCGFVASSAVPARLQAQAQAFPRIQVTAGRSTVITTDFDITRIAVTNPAIADALAVQPREVLVDGKAPGTVSLIVWGGPQRVQYDVVVEQPV